MTNIRNILLGVSGDSDSSGAPEEVSLKREKTKDKTKKNSEVLEEDKNLLTQLLKTPGSDKKKKNKSLTQSQKLKTAGMCILFLTQCKTKPL